MVLDFLLLVCIYSSSSMNASYIYVCTCNVTSICMDKVYVCLNSKVPTFSLGVQVMTYIIVYICMNSNMAAGKGSC